MLTIPQRVQKVREALRLNKTQFAERMMYDRNYVSKVEAGKAPGPRFLRQLEVLEREVAPDERTSQQRAEFDASPRGQLRRAREHAGLTVQELAAKTGSDPGYLRALEEGAAPATQSVIEAICRELPELDAHELMSGSDLPRIMDETGLTGTYGARPEIEMPSGMKARYVPLLSLAQAGAMQEYSDEVYSHEGVLAVNLPTRKAFALAIRGDSMEPRFREGDVAVVYADRAPHSGDVVVAKRADNSVMCKIFKPDEGGWIVLSSYNPAHPPVAVRADELAWVYPVHSVIQQVRPE